MKNDYPSVEKAEELFAKAQEKHGGDYARHSENVAKACRYIAASAGLNADKAYVLGLLHDIGRCEGWTGERHGLDGYNILCAKGYETAARICITHGFIIEDIESSIGPWDLSGEETEWLRDYLTKISYDDYDRLVQLCDALADKNGFCILERRFVDVTIRYGVHPYTVPRWKKTLEIKDHFSGLCGRSIYKLLPDIERNSIQ